VAAETEFCLLGPLVVRRAGSVVPVPAGKQQVLLAVLLLNAGRLVPVDALAEALWGAEPPSSARASLQNHVMRLRNSLAVTGRDRIGTQPGGYLISVDADELDLRRFEAALAAARAAARAGAWADTAAWFRAALSLWRGQPLSGVPSENLALRELPRLAEMRLQALEGRIDADLHLGRHAEVIIELRQLAAAHPLRERLHALLMLALYHSGQQADALAAYQAARSGLVGELGAEPGPELRQLHQQILAADPALAPQDEAGLTGDLADRPVPRQLPDSAERLTGRLAELSALTSMADQAGDAGQTAVICAITGAAGAGKSALAVHWAHQAAGRFPDGQLYVDLRGDAPGQPKPAAEALAEILRSLGVPGQDIPPEAEELAARYRSLLFGRRMLVVLDNTGSAEQVRPLLPGTPACVVLVTSRDPLAGLVAREGARRLEVAPLPLSEAVGLGQYETALL
jgi:DNA-binding SARP family transcriptional activator